MTKPTIVFAVLLLVAGVGLGASRGKKVTVKLTQDQYDTLKKLADEEKSKVSDLIEEAIKTYISDNAEVAAEGKEKEKEKEKGKEEKPSGEDKGGQVTSAESKRFKVEVAGAELLERVEVSYDYSYHDGYKTKVIEVPKGKQFLVVHLDVETLAWGKVQNPDGDGMVPGILLKWKYISLEDKDKRGYPVALLDGRRSKPWQAAGNRQVTIAKSKSGRVRMKRKTSDGWSHYNDGRRMDIYFTVPEDSGPYKLKFVDCDPVDVAPE